MESLISEVPTDSEFVIDYQRKRASFCQTGEMTNDNETLNEKEQFRPKVSLVCRPENPPSLSLLEQFWLILKKKLFFSFIHFLLANQIANHLLKIARQSI